MGAIQARERTFRHPRLTVRGREFEWGRRTYLMGVINLTPDSFSGDGLGGDIEAAVARARLMEAEGADILDVGAESTRPDAPAIEAPEELARLIEPLEAIRAATGLPISVDTYRAEVARAALAVGADIVNDVTALQGDPLMARVVAEAGVPIIAMHNQRGRQFHDVVGDIDEGFACALATARMAGIPDHSIILDPGFGFGWTPEQNLEMLRRLPELQGHRLPLLVGVSRKSTLGLVLERPDVSGLAWGTAAAISLAIAGGADIVRVHDVGEMRDTVRVADAIVRGRWKHRG
ncbi:MAG: dihydropteroate synthase [Dehalococcoidia bacterium]|nr:dihydropteroate synthase [Dehalococcoidia bacterium]